MTVDEMEKARKAHNAYHRRWRAEHKDRVKEINARYWAKRADEEEKNGQSDTEPHTGG